jgi:hypothetical protein
MCRSNGVVIEGPAEFINSPACWFTDGHGDYIRHFMLALGAVPGWAPAGQNHVTGSTTVIKSVTYDPGSNSVAYTTFDNASTESLRLAFTPVAVFVNGTPLSQRSDLSQPGWVFTATNGVLRIRHDTGTNVLIVDQSSNPQAQISETGFGSNTNTFGFDITGASNLVVVVQACTNLTDAGWLPVGTNTLTDGSSYFSDPVWTNFSSRFYRLSVGSP